MKQGKCMISINVEFVGTLQGKVGKRKLKIALDESATVLTLIQALARCFKLNERIFFEIETINSKPSVLILVNGKEISILNSLNTILEDHVSVTFVPISHGG